MPCRPSSSSSRTQGSRKTHRQLPPHPCSFTSDARGDHDTQTLAHHQNPASVCALVPKQEQITERKLSPAKIIRNFSPPLSSQAGDLFEPDPYSRGVIRSSSIERGAEGGPDSRGLGASKGRLARGGGRQKQAGCCCLLLAARRLSCLPVCDVRQENRCMLFLVTRSTLSRVAQPIAARETRRAARAPAWRVAAQACAAVPTAALCADQQRWPQHGACSSPDP